MSEPTPTENEHVAETFSAWQDEPGEPESLPGRALMIAVLLAIIVLVALAVAAVVVFVAG